MRGSLRASEIQPRSELHGASRGCRQLAESIVIDGSDQAAQVGVVQRVEGVGAQLQPKSFGHLERLGESGIQVLEARNADRIVAQIAGTNLFAAQSGDRNGREGGTIEVLVDTRLVTTEV